MLVAIIIFTLILIVWVSAPFQAKHPKLVMVIKGIWFYISLIYLMLFVMSIDSLADKGAFTLFIYCTISLLTLTTSFVWLEKKDLESLTPFKDSFQE